MKNFYTVLIVLMLFSCDEKENKSEDAEALIEKSIKVSGSDKLDIAVYSFDFRDKHYEAGRFDGTYVLKRQFKDMNDTVVDFLSNENFERRINDSVVSVPDSISTKYAASVNSVHYFAVLPYGLNGKAVNKKYLGTIDLKGQSYHKIEVTFDKAGGGEDFEDVFIYWVNKNTLKIDYLAYSYNEDDGKGLRFREAYNERYVKGIRFVDYNNYKPNDEGANLEDLDRLFEHKKLELLSKIELENVNVN